MAFDTGRSQSSNTAEERPASNAIRGSRSESDEQTPASSHASAARHYGLELESEGELAALQRLEHRFGVQRIQQWSREGIPFDAMCHPDGIETYRQSVQRSTEAASDTSPAGDTGVPDTVREVITSQGRSLDPSIQRAMEERMGDSFGDVRIHTGPTAAQACESIDARAFTVGNHVAFNQGEYDPESPEGQHVLAHELAHVRQQTQGAVSMLPQEDAELEVDPDPALEREAEEAAQRAMAGGPVTVNRMGTEVHVQRLKIAEWLGDLFQSGPRAERTEAIAAMEDRLREETPLETVNLAYAPEDQARTVTETLLDADDRGLLDGLEEFTTDPQVSEQKFGESEILPYYDPPERSIWMNPAYATPEQIAEARSDATAAADTLPGAIYHELGHHRHYENIRGFEPPDDMQLPGSTFASSTEYHVRDEGLDARAAVRAIEDVTLPDEERITELMSERAAQDPPYEFVAEMFALDQLDRPIEDEAFRAAYERALDPDAALDGER